MYKFTLTNKNIFKIPTSQTQLHTRADIVKHHVSVHKLEYSTTFKGERITASGLMILPIDTNRAHSLLSYHHGSIFAERNAPSNLTDSLEAFASFHILPALVFAANGYITFVPDYIGHGEASAHLYPDHLYLPAADAVVDMLLAGREFLELRGIPYNLNRLFLAGYSEGGYVTMAAQKALEQRPGLDLTLTASSVGGVALDLSLGLPEINDADLIVAPNVFCRRLVAWNDYYWHRPLTDFFQEPFASRMEWIFNGELDFEETNDQLTTNMYQLMNLEFVRRVSDGEEPGIYEALYVNRLNHWKPETPTRIFKGDQDQYEQAEKEYAVFIDDYRVNPEVVRLVPIEGQNHYGAAYPFVEETLSWFNSFEQGL